MRNVINLAVVAMVAVPALVLGQAGDVNKVLTDMRTALGGVDKVAGVQSLTAVGVTQKTNASGNTTEGEFEVAMELPDKYVARSVLANLGSMSIYRNAGFNGDAAINETENPPNLAGGGHMIVMRREGSGGEATAEEQAAASRRLVMSAKKDFARMTLGMFGSSYDAFPLQFTYAGQADSPDGKADVIGVTGPDGFDAKLFVDSATHLPLMLSWSDKEPLVMTQTIGGPGGASGAGRGGNQTFQMGSGGGAVTTMGRSGGAPPSEEEMKKMMADAEARRAEAEANLRTVEYRIYYSNFRKVNGLNLPHTLQESIDGKPTEQTTFEQIKINPKIDSKKFAVSK